MANSRIAFPRYLPTEEDEQAAVVDWCDALHIPVVHVPNEGKRSKATGARLKRMGMRKGFPDLFIPEPRAPFHGLLIEMKVHPNKPTKDQIEWIEKLNRKGYKAIVCYGATEAINTIREYLEKGR